MIGSLAAVLAAEVNVHKGGSETPAFQVTKEDASEGCTKYAQGGVSAVLAELDSVDAHVHDTMVAGDFLNIRE